MASRPSGRRTMARNPRGGRSAHAHMGPTPPAPHNDSGGQGGMGPWVVGWPAASRSWIAARAGSGCSPTARRNNHSSHSQAELSHTRQCTSEAVLRSTEWLRTHAHARARNRRQAEAERGERDQRRPSRRIAAAVDTAAATAAPRQPPSLQPPPCASCRCCQLTSARSGCGVPARCPWA